ncbi:hypothetical protein AZ270_gp87 [Acidianus tailed spindle virus]|uniref:hypothetical protein n=1 Tax=Acidianus tailed spindle virus TaxID=1797140 RepID=UPI00076F2EE7|nr:hypothetical protein AZ270_gp87 [Acidianus tailed spindle virus]AME30110.1 hypothetical protein ATSV_A186 [Acidianus tailed spindle virus]
MENKGDLSQTPKNQIQFFWDLLNFNKDKLKDLEPQRLFDSLYNHLTRLAEILKGDSYRDSYKRKIFVYQMLKSVMSSLCYIAPLPIIIYSSNTKFYEFGVIRRNEIPVAVVLEYDVEDNNAKPSSIYEINECNEPVDPDNVGNVRMGTGFDYADVLNLEIPGVYKKIRIEFGDDDKIEIKKIEEEE